MRTMARSKLAEGTLKIRLIAPAILFCIVIGNSVAVHASDAKAAPNRIEITAKRFAFAPAEITLKKGEPAVLVLKSADVTHGLRCRELNLDIKSDKGAGTEVHITPDKTGIFIGHCAVFCGSGHGQMILTIRVVE